MVRKKGGNADFQMIFSEVFFFLSEEHKDTVSICIRL